jgi:hypothetical protein
VEVVPGEPGKTLRISTTLSDK